MKPWVQRGVAALLGLLAVGILAEGGLRLGAWAFLQGRHGRDRTPADGALKVLCIGESTTAIGGPDAWPSQLQRILAATPGGQGAVVVNGGIPGVDSSILVSRLPQELDRFQPHVVAAMMGANDNHRGYGGGAVPWDQVPMALRGSFWGRFRLVKLTRQVAWDLARREVSLPVVAPRRTRSPGACDGEPRPAVCGAVDEAWELASRGRVRQARSVLMAASQGSAVARTELGVLFHTVGRGDEAVVAFTEAAAQDPALSYPLTELGGLRLDASDPEGAAQAWQAALVRDPVDADAAVGLGRIAWSKGWCGDVLPALEAATVAHPAHPEAWEVWGTCLAQAGRMEEAETAWRRSLAVLPAHVGRDAAFFPLESWLMVQGLEGEVEILYQEAMARRPWDWSLWSRYAAFLRRTRRSAEAEVYAEQAARMRRETACPLTLTSWSRVQALLEARGIPLVAVQYPRQEVRELVRYFDDPDRVHFVDNKATFDGAVARRGYQAVFMDACYGDFGHATAWGNRLLAQNVAATVRAIPSLATPGEGGP